MLPSIFGENLFDDFFGDPFGMMMPQGRDPLYGKHAKNLMKTDVREMDGSYELDVDLPGRGWIRTSPTRRASTSVRSATPVPAAAASMWARMWSRRRSPASLKTAS